MPSPFRDDDRPVAEADIQALVARAAALDAEVPRALTIAQLRAAALEAGIAEAAIDQALAEWSVPTAGLAPAGPASGPPRSDIGARLRAVARAPFSRHLMRNAVALAGGWALFALVVGVGESLGGDWLMRKALDPVGLLLASVLAYRLRARAAVVISLGFTLAQSVEFVLDLLKGAPAVHGRDPHLLLMAMGLLIASVVTQGGRRPPRLASTVADDPSPEAAPPRPPVALQLARG